MIDVNTLLTICFQLGHLWSITTQRTSSKGMHFSSESERFIKNHNRCDDRFYMDTGYLLRMLRLWKLLWMHLKSLRAHTQVTYDHHLISIQRQAHSFQSASPALLNRRISATIPWSLTPRTVASIKVPTCAAPPCISTMLVDTLWYSKLF